MPTQKRLFDSNEFGSKSISASSIPESGFKFRFADMTETKTKFSETFRDKDGKERSIKLMYSALGVAEQVLDAVGPQNKAVRIEPGDEVQILFNSNKLRSGILQVREKITGKSVILCGFGQDVERHYTLDLAE